VNTDRRIGTKFSYNQQELQNEVWRLVMWWLTKSLTRVMDLRRASRSSGIMSILL